MPDGTDETTGTEGQAPPQGEQKPPEGQDTKAFAQLRKRAETAEARIKTLEERTAKAVAQAAGFDVSKPIAEMALREFCKDREADAFTVEEFKEFATKVGLEPAKAEGTGEQQTGTEGQETDNAAQLDTLQGAADRIRSNTSQAKPAPLAERIAEAEAAGKWDEAMALKDQLLQEKVAPKVPA